MILNFGILTVSDRSSLGERKDAAGPALVKRLAGIGWKILCQDVVPDDQSAVKNTLISWTSHGNLDVILTTGGTGFSIRDITPEATSEVIERPAPGIAEVMRAESMKFNPHAMLSRAVAGIRQKVLIINLPGSPKAALESLEIILPVLPHAVELLHEDPRSESHHSLKNN